MFTTWFLFLLVWFVFLWAVWPHSVLKSFKSLPIQKPFFRQNCNVNRVPCIDDCHFLCIEQDAKCIGGICQSNPADIECHEKTGGVIMALKEPTLHWSCICTDSTFFEGDACDILNPDVCEQGLFLYSDRNHFDCFCFPPYRLIFIHDKPHCAERHVTYFFSAENESYENYLKKEQDDLHRVSSSTP